MKRSASENIWLVIKYVLLIGFTILCVYPLVWLFLASFKTNAELYTNTWGLPEQWSMTNYVNAVVKGGVFRYFGNSVIIAVSVVLVTVILATMASYAIARCFFDNMEKDVDFRLNYFYRKITKYRKKLYVYINN